MNGTLSGERGPRPPVGSRVVAFVVAVLLGCACFVLALFALWPPLPGEDQGLTQALPEVLALGLAGVGAATTLRWALCAHGSTPVVVGWTLGLMPCALVAIELSTR
jgi:sulfite exporter TauE/SafE